MRSRLIITALVAVLCASAARAEDSALDNRMRQQLQSTVQQLRELQDSQASLQAQKAAAEQERDALKAKVGSGARPKVNAAAARRDAHTIADLRAQLAQAKADSAQLIDRAAQAEAELAKTRDLYARATKAGRQLTGERDQTRSTLGVCVAKNDQLYKTGREILDAYAHVGFGTVMGKKEPFLGLERVKLENLAQDHRDRLDAGRFDPKLDHGPAPAAPSGGQP